MTTLKAFVLEPIRTDRDKAGVIQAFEFTLEQCWKAVQQEATQVIGRIQGQYIRVFENLLKELQEN